MNVRFQNKIVIITGGANGIVILFRYLKGIMNDNNKYIDFSIRSFDKMEQTNLN